MSKDPLLDRDVNSREDAIVWVVDLIAEVLRLRKEADRLREQVATLGWKLEYQDQDR
jgi:hypothetical protein